MRWCSGTGWRRPGAAALAVMASTGLLVACGGSADASTVRMLDNRYVPDHIEVEVGERLDFVNDGRVNHNVIDVDGAFDSRDGHGDHQPGQTWSHTFTEPGVHSIYCSLHATQAPDGTWQGMVGAITVVS